MPKIDPQINLDLDTAIDLKHLPEGFTPEDAEDVRQLLVRLKGRGLALIFGAAGKDLAFHLASGSARTVHGMALVMVEQSGRMFCACPVCQKAKTAGRVLA